MKKILLFAFVVVVLISVSNIVVGKETKPVRPGGGAGAKRSMSPQVRDRGASPMQGRDRGASMQVRGREMMAARQAERMKEDIDRATKVHKDFAAELEAIKKLAEEEGAKKTAAKIQELIDKDKKKLEKKVADLKKRTEEFMKRMKGGPGGRGSGPEGMMGGGYRGGSGQGRGAGGAGRGPGGEHGGAGRGPGPEVRGRGPGPGGEHGGEGK